MNNWKIKVKNHRNREEELVLNWEEFKKKFKTELDVAIEGYKKQEENKNFLPSYIKNPPDYEQDFYMSFIFNFNNYVPTTYYIAKIN